jgi:hypothetical protein
MVRTIGGRLRMRRYLSGNRAATGSTASCGYDQPQEEQMSAVTTSYEPPATTHPHWHPSLRRIVAGAAVFDAAMGIFCLVDGGRVGGWLSISSAAVRATGVVFLVAAVAGVETAVRPKLGIRWVVGANLLFAAWCLGTIGLDSPDGAGAALLVLAAVSSASNAALEGRLSR